MGRIQIVRRDMLLTAVLVFAVASSAVTSPSGSTPAGPSEAGSSDWIQVDTGTDHTCGIRSSGRLFCWGQATEGQLGHGGPSLAPATTPREVAGGATDWVQVGVGGAFTCGLRQTGRLYCWGSDSDGQLGNGAAVSGNVDVPVQVAGNATTWASVTADYSHVCARRTNGRLYCWGDDSYGQLGNGAALTADRVAPTPVVGNTIWASVTVGGYHTCARRTDGRLFCWGDDSFGQLGNGATVDDNQVAPSPVAGNTTWASVSAGGRHTCTRRADGRLSCWGSDTRGQLGNGATSTGNRVAPTQVTGTTWASVSAGTYHSCGRTTAGRLFCWGSDTFGELGNGPNLTDDQPQPSEVAGRADDWRIISAGPTQTCATIATGRLFCWGFDFYGQLGDGDLTTGSNRPSQVLGPGSF